MVAYLLTEDSKQKSQLVSMAATSESNNGATPLHVACQRNLSDIAAYLLRCNASPLVTNAAGQTAFDLACSGGHSDTVAVLLPACRGFLTEVVSFTDCSPLEEAARGGHANVVQQLLEAGFRVNARSGCGDGSASVGGTALHAACAGLRHSTVQLLLSAGANPAARDCSGRTVVELLQSFGSPEHLRLAEDVACRAELNSSRRDSKATATTGAQQQPPPRPPPPRSLLVGDDSEEGRSASPTPTPRPRLSAQLQQQQAAPVPKRRSMLGANSLHGPADSTTSAAGQMQPSARPRQQRATIMLLPPSKASTGVQPPKRPPPPPHLRGLTFNEEQQASGQQQQPEAAGEYSEPELLISIDADGSLAPITPSTSSARSSSRTNIDLLTMSLAGVENLPETAEPSPAARQSVACGDLLDLTNFDNSTRAQSAGQDWEPIRIDPISQPIAEELDSGSCQPISDDHLGSSSRLSAEEIAGQESHIVSDETKEDSQPISDETKEDSQPISEETKEDSQPISEENKEDSQPISDETKEDSQPISEENKEDSQPISDETKEDSQPTSDETKEDSQPISDETKEDSQPMSEENKQDSQPISDETKEDSQPIPDKPKEDSQPISDETKEDSQPIPDKPKEDSQPISDETKEDSQPISDETKEDSQNSSGTLNAALEPIYDEPRRHSKPLSAELQSLLSRTSVVSTLTPEPEPEAPLPSPRGQRASTEMLLDLSSPEQAPTTTAESTSSPPLEDSPLTDWKPLSIVVQPRISRQSRFSGAATASVVSLPLVQETNRLGSQPDCWPAPVTVGDSTFYL
ncbi:hypothetical protein BOX15_Mlig006733g1 [Macrostomum lignano]|uniref:Uncharacterized protein n=1 Tax=Macrostomum lignano TaxID=282301 RepID=A0A267FMP5_9PLAT|nr:hypothetical protein BOX15_Mlig006733g1 [Macrostomum lignano]